MKLFLKFHVLKSANVEMELAQCVPSKMDDQRPPPKPVMKEKNRDEPSSFQRENPRKAKGQISEWLWSSRQHLEGPRRYAWERYLQNSQEKRCHLPLGTERNSIKFGKLEQVTIFIPHWYFVSKSPRGMLPGQTIPIIRTSMPIPFCLTRS